MTNNPFSQRWYIFMIRFVIVILSLATIWLVITVNGYRFLTNPVRVVKTGLISLKIHPNNDVLVFLNGQALPNGQRIMNELSPGRYTLRIEKPGYYPWESTSELRAGLALVYEIVLFSSAPAVLILTEPNELERYQKLLVEPERFQAGLKIVDRELWAEEQFVTRYAKPIKQALWYPGKSHILVLIDRELHVVETTGDRDILLYVFPESSTEIQFVPVSNGQFLVVASGSQLQRLEITAARPLLDLPTFQTEEKRLE